MSFSFSRRDFPNDFIFGVATAAYQIEGSKFGNCGSSHWDTWSETGMNYHQLLPCNSFVIVNHSSVQA